MPGASGEATAVPDASAVAVVEASGHNQEPMDVALSKDDGIDESDSLSRMTTLPLSPSSMDALAVGGLRKSKIVIQSLMSTCIFILYNAIAFLWSYCTGHNLYIYIYTRNKHINLFKDQPSPFQLKISHFPDPRWPRTK